MPELPKSTQVVVIGAGQAGIAASEHLKSHGLTHVVLEKSRIAESWQTSRWDSLVANGPAWHDKFPNLDFKGDQDGFASKSEIAEYMADYAKMIDMPVYTGIEVASVTRKDKALGFSVATKDGQQIECLYVISATGAFQIPVSPSLVPTSAVATQMHSMDYKNPSQLPEHGNVLVVGAGSSGAQIADELSTKTNRKVFLSVGPHDRPPRSYRGRDFCWWLGVLNKWDMETQPGSDHTTIAVSGANGGRTMDFRRLASQGVVLLGRTNAYGDGKLTIGHDLVQNVTNGDENYLNLLREADEYIDQHGLDLPLEVEAHTMLPDPECLTSPVHELDLDSAGITAIIWSTGFRADYSWLAETQAVAGGKPSHKRGISTEPGIYFLGLPWQTRRGSSFIWGVWYDAKYVTDHIRKQQMYIDYKPSGRVP